MPNETVVEPSPAPAHEEWELKTLEQDAEEEIDRLRTRANEMEVALARAPLAIRRMTRLQASKLGIHF